MLYGKFSIKKFDADFQSEIINISAIKYVKKFKINYSLSLRMMNTHTSIK